MQRLKTKTDCDRCQVISSRQYTRYKYARDLDKLQRYMQSTVALTGVIR
jgi:hypothetical protein